MNVNKLMINDNDSFIDIQDSQDESLSIPESDFLNTPSHQSEASNTSNNTTSCKLYSTKSQSRNKGGVFKSSVWLYFNVDSPEPVCKKCSVSFASTTGTSSLRRHLESHQIIAPKKRQKKIDYDIPYSISEWQECDDVVVEWIISDTQPFSVIENKAW
ncbi:17270_t:CDS:1 [Cetraspora pellucida]|uniref:17270_t:CDS:1 n=1 Tax=Cetraspora pellucida TaxID=1433469 RepID=A0ACA9LGG2_9GLOM|nr:17270_t:CDS:1 [Cetraspora pellucida]